MTACHCFCGYLHPGRMGICEATAPVTCAVLPAPAGWPGDVVRVPFCWPCAVRSSVSVRCQHCGLGIERLADGGWADRDGRVTCIASYSLALPDGSTSDSDPVAHVPLPLIGALHD